MENVKELKSMMMKYEEENSDGGLSGFLEVACFYTDLDSVNEDEDTVIFDDSAFRERLEPKYLLSVWSEGIFPGRMSNTQEELRRTPTCLCRYSCCKNRLLDQCGAEECCSAQTQYNN